MGFAEHLTEEKTFEKLDKIFLENLLQEVNIGSIQQNKLYLWIIEFKIDLIKERANFNIPTNCKPKIRSES
jgi:hypothetical protein